MSLNKVFLQGRLTKDVELRKTQSDVSVTSFDIAVDRDYSKPGEDKQTDFIRIQAWRSTAEFVAKYMHKGSAVIVEGSLQNDNYVDKDGVKHYSFAVVADRVHFGESKRDAAQDYTSAPTNFSEDEAPDDDLPF